MASYDVTVYDQRYSLRQGRGPSYLESWRKNTIEPPVKERKPLKRKRGNAPKGRGRNNGRAGIHAPSSAAVKTNPLFTKSLLQQQHTMEVSEPTSKQSDVPDLTPVHQRWTMEKTPTFYAQQTNIRMTKDREMIAAIVDLAKYGEKEMGPKKQGQSRMSLLMKAKMLGKKGKPQQQCKRGAFFLRGPPLRTRNTVEFIHF